MHGIYCMLAGRTSTLIAQLKFGRELVWYCEFISDLTGFLVFSLNYYKEID